MKTNSLPVIRFLLLLVLLAAPALACNAPGGQEQPDLTQQAFEQSVAGTQTAKAVEEESQNELPTAQAQATQTSQVIQATQTAMVGSRDESQLATATVAAPVLAELPTYNVDTTKGQVGWLHPPAKIELEGKNQFGYANDFMQVIAKDFVLAADVTWDTQYGSSGCGFMFRSDGDKNKPNQYMVLATRLGNGHVIFSATADGELANVHDYYPRMDDRSFSAENGSTNRITVVGRGNIIEIYTNGVKIGEVDTTQPPSSPVLPPPPAIPTNRNDPVEMNKYQKLLQEHQDMISKVKTNFGIALNNYKKTKAVYDEGFVAMLGVSESGHTVCQFDNAWLWLIE